MKPAFSSITILNCSGDIPKKTACLIDANSYEVKISRIDICQNSPLPKFRSSPDFSGASCINLFDKKKSRKYNLNKLAIPKTSNIKESINILHYYLKINLLFLDNTIHKDIYGILPSKSTAK